MQNFIQKFRQSSIVFEKLCILSEKWKTLTSSNYHRVSYFLLKLCTRFLLTNVYKRVFKILFISFQSWVGCQNQKRRGFYTLLEIRLINISSSKQNKKSQTHFCRHCQVGNVSKISAKKPMVTGARQSFQFFRHLTWFLENNRAYSKFTYRVLHYLISIIKLQNN